MLDPRRPGALRRRQEPGDEQRADSQRRTRLGERAQRRKTELGSVPGSGKPSAV
ncbi:MAG: hypothetical protein ACRDQ5_22320 [Sciscionella sp.]